MTAEKKRLSDPLWKYWGPYLSDRQWGTVREDYSPDGSAWGYLTHDMARSKAYRWGEDGIGGISDSKQRLCFSLSTWNGLDRLLKERLFGLGGNEGNHGEDVKEYYAYLDSTPTHSYMKMLYKYPQREFPYQTLIEENRKRTKKDPEFEIFDTGIFNDDRYFDIYIEYAKASPEDILIKISAINRGPAEAPIHLIPQIWFRNTWAWDLSRQKPNIALSPDNHLILSHAKLATYTLHYEDSPQPLFCENETNSTRLFGVHNAQGTFKDGINDYIVSGRTEAINASQSGTKSALHFQSVVKPGETFSVRLRLTADETTNPFGDWDSIFSNRIIEADNYYKDIQADITTPDARLIQRQAFAGMLWSKQFYYYDVHQWLNGDPSQPEPPSSRHTGRNINWEHVRNADIISMPDTWEYPWFAAWDLAFHCIPLSMIDPDFAKEQLLLLTKDWYMHPNGQLPAYEWAFGDVNPPVHAWATWRVYKIDRKGSNGKGDLEFLEKVFVKLLINFTWWINQKDKSGNNLFQGGFLGLDNIGVFDRSAELPTGGFLQQADATAWMAMYCLNMMTIALELSLEKPVYQDLASKFFEHFLYIAEAMVNIGGTGVRLWNDEDQFYYDVLQLPNGQMKTLKIRSLVGLIPLFAVETLDPEMLEKLPKFNERLQWFLKYRPHLASLVSSWEEPGRGKRRLLSLLRGQRVEALLRRLLDEEEFLSDYGVRALSKFHQNHPYVLKTDKGIFTVNYQPAESDTEFFGGNSNWRGPIWFPTNFLIIESLQKFHHYYGENFTFEYPVGSGKMLTLDQVAQELSLRLTKIFLRDSDGRRPVFGSNQKLQNDLHFRDHILFFEYFHGDNGSGIGASHQTGWTGLIAKLLQPRRDESAVIDEHK
jgi:hypothetical protein